MRYKLREQVEFTDEQQRIIDLKMEGMSKSGELEKKLKRLISSPEDQNEFFNKIVDRYSNVISEYANIIPKTDLEESLFNISLGKGSGAGNIGPGEAFIVFSTSNTKFGTVGDINNNGVEIEIKRSAGKEIALTYTAGGIFKFFPIFQSLNSLVDNIMDTIGNFKSSFTKLSKPSKLLFLFLRDGVKDLKFEESDDFESKTFQQSFLKYKDLFSFTKSDFIESDVDKEFISEINRDISRKINKLLPSAFEEGMLNASKTYFGKGFDYILFYQNDNKKASLFTTDDVERILLPKESVIRNGYTIYFKVDTSLLKEAASKYSTIDKIDRGYGLNYKFIQYVYSGLIKIQKITS